MRFKFFLLVLLQSLLITAQEKVNVTTNIQSTILVKNQKLSEKEFQDWFHKDYGQDTIPGISLEKAYQQLLANKKGQEVIVAVLDTKLDIHHKDLKQQIWMNADEIPANNVDDDKNGYIDDVNGWDFLGNQKGEYIKYENSESARVVRKYSGLFKNKEEKDITPEQKKTFHQYKKAEKSLLKAQQENEEQIINVSAWIERLKTSKIVIDSLLPDREYKLKELDSLKLLHKNDSIILGHIETLEDKIKYNFTDQYLANYIVQLEERNTTMLNPNFNEREIIGDNPEDINDINYGYNQVYGDVPFQHATSVTGVLAATRNNNLGINGISDNIKIMPVVMVASGDEHDKDVALAIRYAVDNGAKVINMSWGKNISLHEEWVNNAIKYAKEKDVLLVTAAGNDGRSIENEKYYPNDYMNTSEFVDNFIVVGASSYTTDKNVLASFSNYGKNNVDIFAPGDKMYTTGIENRYEFSRGTSLASPIVSGVGALIRSYYPKLSAKEVKEVLMQSGTSYNIEVEIEQEDGSKKLVPFSELSKSGKVVNAYNALLMAEKISKAKK